MRDTCMQQRSSHLLIPISEAEEESIDEPVHCLQDEWVWEWLNQVPQVADSGVEAEVVTLVHQMQNARLA